MNYRHNNTQKNHRGMLSIFLVFFSRKVIKPDKKCVHKRNIKSIDTTTTKKDTNKMKRSSFTMSFNSHFNTHLTKTECLEFLFIKKLTRIISCLIYSTEYNNRSYLVERKIDK